jgi:hypothetical protein
MNMRKLMITLGIAAAIGASCKSNRPAPTNYEKRIADARVFTTRYSQPAIANWNVRAHAAGSDCAVLFVETSIILEDAMIEAMYYGAGAYEPIYPGGVQRFSREHAFRGVAYKDVSGRIWTYGRISRDEALTSCH